MGVHHGNEGVVKISSDEVAEVQNWTYNEEDVALLAKTSIGDTEETYNASGCKRGSGSISVLWDETDASGQGAMTVGTSVTLNLYPEGADTDDVYLTGTAVIETMGKSSSKDGYVTKDFGFKGVLSEATV